ncbi:cytochrome P450 [Biscogniauxia mediterranea]|nr:cytochrome P450 [Biscogniauxia mediterranea]
MAFLEGYRLLWAFLIATLVCHRIFLRIPRIQRNGVPLKKPSDTMPIVGDGLRFLQARQKLFTWFVKCERQFGYETFQITVPTLHPGVVINDPKNLDYVFKNEGIFAKGEFVKWRSWDLFGYGIINADGELWKIQRKAGLNFLNTSNLRVLTDVALPRYLGQSIDLLKKHSCDGSVVDLQTVFHEITSQLMGKMAYDMEMHADDDFTIAFDFASGATTERFQNPLWFITEPLTGSRFRKSLTIIRDFGKEIVDNAIQNRGHIGKPSPKSTADDGRLDKVSGSLIQSLLDSLGTERGLVADAALNYLSAGRDTVAQSLTWTFYLLMHKRSVVDKIRSEVQELFDGQEGTAHGNESGETMKSTIYTPASLPYTMAVFYEALRLYPPIPFEIKECEKATTLPDGTFLPEGSVVLWCPWAMNRSRISWGDDADAFRPDRWLTEDGKLISKTASEFPVFNGGVRTCLGKRMAELIAVQVIAKVVQMFDFMPAYDGERVSKSSLTLPMQGGLPSFVKLQNNIPR